MSGWGLEQVGQARQGRIGCGCCYEERLDPEGLLSWQERFCHSQWVSGSICLAAFAGPQAVVLAPNTLQAIP